MTARLLSLTVALVVTQSAAEGLPDAGPSPGDVVQALLPRPAASVPENPLDAPVPLLGKWSPQLYGFIELDAIADSTQSFNDLQGNAQVARPDTYAGQHGRMMMGVRNSRLGFRLASPDFHGVRATGVMEMDFLGNQPPGISEAAFFGNPGLRVRHFALKLESRYVDLTLGQTWELFGFQPYFHPGTVTMQGDPAQVYSRAPQLRLSHVFKAASVNVEVAAAAVRPVQRDSLTPDGQAGVRVLFNNWKTVRGPGSTSTSYDAAAIAVSGVVRRFDAPEFSATPKADVAATGWGFSVDGFLPIVRATMGSRANSLSLTGSYVRGAGIADLYTGFGNAVGNPALPNPDNKTPAPTYAASIDNGLALYDGSGALRPVLWQSALLGLQYYLPPDGHLWVTVNGGWVMSNNAASFGSASKVYWRSRWGDVNLFWEPLLGVRLGLEYAYTTQTLVDGTEAPNHRVQFSAFYIF